MMLPMLPHEERTSGVAIVLLDFQEHTTFLHIGDAYWDPGLIAFLYFLPADHLNSA